MLVPEQYLRYDTPWLEMKSENCPKHESEQLNAEKDFTKLPLWSDKIVSKTKLHFTGSAFIAANANVRSH